MTSARRRAAGFGCAVALLSAVAWPAGAEVKTRVRPDGTLEIYNDGPGGAPAPRQLRLEAVPRADWGDWIREHAANHGLDPRLVQAIVQVESGYNSRARSHKGAVGLMQLMPATARQLQVGDRYNAEQNIRGGVAYLRQMVDLFPGHLELAIAAYNAGPSAVQRHNGVPPYRETRDYVQRVMALYRGGSSLLLGFSGGGVPRLNGLAQDQVPSPLQQALASGRLRPAAPAPLATLVTQATAAPPSSPPAVPVPTVPAATSVSPQAVVPASMPVAGGPAPLQPATGG